MYEFHKNNFPDILFEPLVLIPQFTDMPLENRDIFFTLTEKFQDYTEIYTDDSKNPHGTGFAVLIPNKDKIVQTRLPKEAAIFIAESLAVLEAKKHITESSVIFLDSRSVLQSLHNINVDSPSLIVDICISIVQLRLRGIRVAFVWIKVHAGFQYNEKVDELAKAAILSDHFLPIITKSDLIKYFYFRIKE